MSAKNEQRSIENIKFSIGAKLIMMTLIILIFSIGLMTAFVSRLVSREMRAAAEENNIEANRRSAIEAETLITNVRSNSRVLLQTVAPAGAENDTVRQTVNVFFQENQQIAVVFFIANERAEQLLVNKQFFFLRELDEILADYYFQGQRGAIARAIRGETLLLNATPHFTRAALALFFPLQNGGAAGVVFSSEGLINNFGLGTNQSYMINNEGVLLAHSDFNLVRSAVNISDEKFIRSILDSAERSRQELIQDEFRFMHGLSGAVEQNFFVTIWENIKYNTLTVFTKAANGTVSGVFRFLRFINIEEFFNIRLNEPVFNFVHRDSPQIAYPQANEPALIRQFTAYSKLNTQPAIVITGVEYSKVFERIAAAASIYIFLIIAVLIILIIFVRLFSRTISAPLKTLAGAVHEIGNGVFEPVIEKRKRRDEIGLLSDNFHRMCSALNTFGRFTNKEIAVKAMRGEINPGGLQKQGTVFFSDIHSFNSISESFINHFRLEAPELIVQWLNEYLAKMIDCVERTNGITDKFIGDAVMAHWGTVYSAGSPRKDAFNCIKAALMMRKALYYMNKERSEENHSNPVIRIGCGIDSGMVIAGQIGSDLRTEYTVLGEPVNIASRIKALTRSLGVDILITENTWNLVGDKFITEEMPAATVKGKPVRVFAVVNMANSEKKPQTLDDVRQMLGNV